MCKLWERNPTPRCCVALCSINARDASGCKPKQAMEPIQNGLDSLGTYYLIQPECWVRVILYWLIYGPRMNLRSFIILLWASTAWFCCQDCLLKVTKWLLQPQAMSSCKYLPKAEEEITFSLCPFLTTRSSFSQYSYLALPHAPLARIIS